MASRGPAGIGSPSAPVSRSSSAVVSLRSSCRCDARCSNSCSDSVGSAGVAAAAAVPVRSIGAADSGAAMSGVPAGFDMAGACTGLGAAAAATSTTSPLPITP